MRATPSVYLDLELRAAAAECLIKQNDANKSAVRKRLHGSVNNKKTSTNIARHEGTASEVKK